MVLSPGSPNRPFYMYKPFLHSDVGSHVKAGTYSSVADTSLPETVELFLYKEMFRHRNMPDTKLTEMIKSIVDKRLEEDMSLFKNVISSMIDRKLSDMELSSVSNLSLNEISVDTETEIIKELSKMDFVKLIAYSKEDSKIRLIIIHSSSDRSKAFDKIAESVLNLDDRMPEFFIEPWILHESETQPSYLEDAKIILNVQ